METRTDKVNRKAQTEPTKNILFVACQEVGQS
jgi:hypothetical protein